MTSNGISFVLESDLKMGDFFSTGSIYSLSSGRKIIYLKFERTQIINRKGKTIFDGSSYSHKFISWHAYLSSALGEGFKISCFFGAGDAEFLSEPIHLEYDKSNDEIRIRKVDTSQY